MATRFAAPGCYRFLAPEGRYRGWGLIFPVTIPIVLSLGGGFQCGADPGSPVTDAYQPPFAFDGKLYNVVVDVSGDLIKDQEAQAKMLFARQ